jgi:hypothetical protein
MTVIRRVAPPVAVLAVLGTALTACGSGPSQVNSAVIIGDRVISVDSVQQRLDTALKNEPAARRLAAAHKLDEVSRHIVGQLVRHELIADVAKRDNLTVSDKQVADVVASLKPSDDDILQSVRAAFDPNELVRDQLLISELGRKNLATRQLILNGAAIFRPDFTAAKASDLARQMAAKPDRIPELAKAAAGPESPDNQSGAVTDVKWNAIARFGQAAQQSQTGQAPPSSALFGSLFAAPNNSVITYGIGVGGPQAGWLVVQIRTDSAGVPSDQAALASQVPDDWAMDLGQHLLGANSGDLGIRVSPRYGVWDPLAVEVVADADQKIGEVFPVSSPRP